MSLGDLLRTITNLGDPVLLAPAAALLLAYLLVCGTRRAAWLWAVAFGASLVLVTLAKLGLRMHGEAVLDVRSPSGHTGMSAVVYLGTAIVLGRGLARGARIAALAAAMALVLAIAWSRQLLGAHDWAENVIGSVIGGGAALWFARRSAAEPIAPRLRVTFAAVLVALAVAVSGWHVTAETGIRQIAKGHWPKPHVVRQGRETWLIL